MSQETVLPPQRPSGPEEEHSHEGGLLRSETHAGCGSPSGPPDPKAKTGSCAPRDASADGARGSSASSDLIRKQPHPLARPAASVSDPSEGGACPLQTGPHAELSYGKGVPPGVPHAGAEPVAGGLPRKLQSSLSGHSSSSSSTISSQSHKPGSSPEDCCVHCILACLFCEFLALCNMALSQASCGGGGGGPDACCCCCWAGGAGGPLPEDGTAGTGRDSPPPGGDGPPLDGQSCLCPHPPPRLELSPTVSSLLVSANHRASLWPGSNEPATGRARSAPPIRGGWGVEVGVMRLPCHCPPERPRTFHYAADVQKSL
ncbi:hypothetical protein MATL_G00262650 [Megalops atlanticus]|uniref:Uncharacterized protein n=1 Tax=Megalops atlanticus TaxID=7932 RepID=A0A9D3SVX2_MEGAT|nr:hypothetical protein MATL_G00262650 [Megalops atlanticus]